MLNIDPRWFTVNRQATTPSKRIGTTALAGDVARKRKQAPVVDPCGHEQMDPRLERAVDHPNMTPELATAHSRQKTCLDYRTETEIVSDGDEG